MGGRTQAELAAEFREIQSCANRRGDPVWHVSLAAHPSEQFCDQQWALFAIELINRVGRLADPQNEVGISTEKNQYVVIRHHNEEHSHVHILLNRVNLQGQTCYCNWSIKTLHTACAELERDYGLVQCDHDKSQRNGKKQHSSMSPQAVLRLEQKETQTGTKESVLEKERSRLSVRSFLQEAIDSATADSPSMPLLLKRLKQQGIDAQIAYTRTGKVKGISYALEEARFTGTLLGKHYTFQGLQKYKGVQYEKSQDELIRQISAQSPAVITPETQPHESPQTIPIVSDESNQSRCLDEVKQAKLEPLADREPQPEQNSQEMHLLVEQFYAHASRLWNQRKSMAKEVSPGKWILQGNRYAITYDTNLDHFWVSDRQRGVLVENKASKLSFTQELTPEDVENFSQVVQQQQAQKPLLQHKPSQLER
jgi:hypothetical protein